MAEIGGGDLVGDQHAMTRGVGSLFLGSCCLWGYYIDTGN